MTRFLLGSCLLSNVFVIKAMLRNFEIVSSLKNSCGEEVMERFLKILNCRMMSFPFTYLDVPIEVNPRCERTWVLILEKISKKLVSWKHKHFSLGGRVCLPQFGNILFCLVFFIYLCSKFLQRWLIRLLGCKGLFCGEEKKEKKNSMVYLLKREQDGLGLKDIVLFNELNRDGTFSNKRDLYGERSWVLNMLIIPLGVWDFRWRREWFQWELELVEKFNKMERVSLKRGVEDTWWWEGEPNDGYSIPPKVAMFVWRPFLDRLPSKENLSKRNVIVENDVCGKHVIIGSNLNPFCLNANFSLLPEFFDLSKRGQWDVVWCATASWSIWRHMNALVFRLQNMVRENIMQDIIYSPRVD
ncbi:hypothetical protein GmHk_01G000435 [Glycine max]|nr:hypothetical protein GmHk_01G000435 [Glycine max]